MTRAALAFVVIENYAHEGLVYCLCRVVTSDSSGAVSSPPGVGKMMMGRLDRETAWTKGQWAGGKERDKGLRREGLQYGSVKKERTHRRDPAGPRNGPESRGNLERIP